jgi:hypothetical protein
MLRKRRTSPPYTEIFPAKVSSSTDGWWWAKTDPCNVLSTDEEKVWNAGKFAPAFIHFEFNPPVRCTRIALLPCMSPKSGSARHEICVGSRSQTFFLNAADRKWILVDVTNKEPVKCIRIQTLESPSFVAWRRVQFWTE